MKPCRFSGRRWVAKGTVNLAAVPALEGATATLVGAGAAATPPGGQVGPRTGPLSAVNLDFKPLVLGIDEYQMYLYESWAMAVPSSSRPRTVPS